MGRKHLGVRVDIDTRAGRLFEQHLEVLQVVAGDQDARVLPDAEVDLGDLRIPVGLSVGTVKQIHALDAVGARLERKRHQVVDRERIVERGCQRTLDEGIDALVALAKHVRVLRIGREALEAVDDELAEGADILVLGRKDADRACLGSEACTISTPEGGVREAICGGELCQEPIVCCERLLDALLDCLAVEVRIRDRREEVRRHKAVDLLRDLLALCTQLRGKLGGALGHIDQKVLEPCNLRGLAADAALRAARASSGLLALEAEHRCIHHGVFFLSC